MNTAEQTFQFWKDNLIDREYTLPLSEVQKRYTRWLKSQDNPPLTKDARVHAFVAMSDGLCSTAEGQVYMDLIDKLHEEISPEERRILGSQCEALKQEASAVITNLLIQVNQMRGMFPDEDGAIADAVNTAEAFTDKLNSL